MGKETIIRQLVDIALTDADRAQLNLLAARPDSEIDTTDIPEWTDEQWKHAERGKFYRPVKI